MLRLRQYKPEDAATIISWCRDEETFRKWTSDRYGSFPITADDMNQKYIENNGDCEEADNFYPLTAFDENGIVGHLILRYMGEDKKIIRIGFVIVDEARRGEGYGREMIRLALIYAFDLLKAERVTLGVFDNNPSAYRCYKAAGFKEYSEREVFLLGQNWRCIDMECRRDA